MDGRKQSTKSPAKPGTPEVSHLDQQLTDLTRGAIAQAKRWRNAIIGVVAAAVLGVAAYTIFGALAESQVRSINERLYRLIDTAAAQKDDYVIDKAEVDRLADDVRGKRSEAYVLRRLADFYIGRAELLARKKASLAAVTPGSVQPTPEVAAASPAEIDANWEQALRLADLAAQRFADEVDVQTWAAKVKSRVEGERKKDWLPKAWKYTLPEPKSVPAGGSEPPPAAAPPAAAPSADVAPPAAVAPPAGAGAPAAPTPPAPPEK